MLVALLTPVVVQAEVKGRIVILPNDLVQFALGEAMISFVVDQPGAAKPAHAVRGSGLQIAQNEGDQRETPGLGQVQYFPASPDAPRWIPLVSMEFDPH